MELFAKIVNGFQLSNIFSERSTLDVRLGFKWVSDENSPLLLEINEKCKDSWVKIYVFS